MPRRGGPLVGPAGATSGWESEGGPRDLGPLRSPVRTSGQTIQNGAWVRQSHFPGTWCAWPLRNSSEPIAVPLGLLWQRRIRDADHQPGFFDSEAR